MEVSHEKSSFSGRVAILEMSEQVNLVDILSICALINDLEELYILVTPLTLHSLVSNIIYYLALASSLFGEVTQADTSDSDTLLIRIMRDKQVIKSIREYFDTAENRIKLIFMNKKVRLNILMTSGSDPHIHRYVVESIISNKSNDKITYFIAGSTLQAAVVSSIIQKKYSTYVETHIWPPKL